MMAKAKKNSAEYWAERIAAGTWEIYNSAEEKNRALLAMYKDASQQITNELYRLAEKLQKQGFKNTDVHRNNQLVKLNVEILKVIKQLGGDVESFEQESMFSAFAENYEMISDAIGGVDFAMPNKKAMEKMMHRPWRGGDFSSRLWKNTKQLSVVLNDTLLHGIQQGKTVTEMAVDIDNQMQSGFNAAHRLARTETMHVLNESSKEAYKAAGVKKIQFWAAEDERTCDQCGKLHGKEYEIGKEPTLPLHPNCRCTYLPVLDLNVSVRTEKRLNDIAKGDIIQSETAKEDNHMAFIKTLGKIDVDILEKEFGKIQTNEVVVTEERLTHIKDRHPEDYDLFEKYGKESVEMPDMIIKDGKHDGTVFMVKQLADTNLNVVVRVVLESDNPDLKNSVMTFYRIRARNLRKLIEKNELLYKKE